MAALEVVESMTASEPRLWFEGINEHKQYWEKVQFAPYNRLPVVSLEYILLRQRYEDAKQ